MVVTMSPVLSHAAHLVEVGIAKHKHLAARTLGEVASGPAR